MLNSIPRKGNLLIVSENQRINLQRRKENNPFLSGKKLECFFRWMVVEDLSHLNEDFIQVKMWQNKRLQTDNQLFFKRKNKVVGELDFAVEIVAAAFGAELEWIVLPKMSFGFCVLKFMVEAMQTIVCHCTEAARQLMVFSAVMELHIPSDRDKQYHECH